MAINVTNISPAPGAPIALGGALQFDLTWDPTPTTTHLILLGYGNDTEVIWDGTGFLVPYSGSSRTEIPDGYRYVIRRSGRWPATPSIAIRDLGGDDGGGGDPGEGDVDPTPDTLALRGEDGELNATAFYGGSFVGPSFVGESFGRSGAGEMTVGGDATVLGITASTTAVLVAPTIELNATNVDVYAGANHRLRLGTAASVELIVKEPCSQFALAWEQDASGAGAATYINGQKGAIGFAGGKVGLFAGAGGNPGATGNPGGGIDLVLRTQVGGTTDKLAIKEESTEFLGIRRAGTVATIESPGSIHVRDTVAAVVSGATLAPHTVSVLSAAEEANPYLEVAATRGRTLIKRAAGYADGTIVGARVDGASLATLAPSCAVELISDGTSLWAGPSSGLTLWNERELPGFLLDFDPGIASTLTLSGSDIQVARDAQGRGNHLFAPSGREPNRNTVDLLDGYAGADFASAGSGDALEAAAGGVTGASPHAIVYVGTIGATGYGALARMGSPVTGTPGTPDNSIIAGNTGSAYWGGGAGHLTPAYGGTPSGIRVHVKTYDGTTRKIFLDGELVDSAAYTYAIVGAGYGIGPWTNSFLTTGRCYRYLAAAGTWTRADVDRLMRAFFARYPSLRRDIRIVVEGTSIEKGDAAAPGGGTLGNCWPERMLPSLNRTTSLSNVATGGALLSGGGGLAAIRARVDDKRSMLNRGNIAIIGGCVTNDIPAGRTAAQCIADMKTYLADTLAQGFTVFSCSLLARSFSGPQQLVADEYMRWWENWVPAHRKIDWRNIPQALNSANTTYFHDGTHQTHALNILMAAYAAQRINAEMGW